MADRSFINQSMIQTTTTANNRVGPSNSGQDFSFANKQPLAESNVFEEFVNRNPQHQGTGHFDETHITTTTTTNKTPAPQPAPKQPDQNPYAPTLLGEITTVVTKTTTQNGNNLAPSQKGFDNPTKVSPDNAGYP